MNISDNEGRFTPSTVLPSLWGVGAAVASAIVLLFAAGVIVYSTADPNGLVPVASVLILMISSLVAGVAGAKTGGGFVHGAVAGAVFAMIIFITAVIAGGEGSLPSPYSYLTRIAAVIVSLLGAYLGARRGRRKIGGAPKKPKIKR